MRQLAAFIKKEFLHIFRDKRTLLIILGMPAAQIIIFGFAITNDIKNSSIAVIDGNRDYLTGRIVERMTAGEYFDLEGYYDGTAGTEKLLKKGDADIVMVFGPGFTENLKSKTGASLLLVADASDPNRAVTLVNYASAIVAETVREFSDPETVPVSSGGSYESGQGHGKIAVVSRLLYNPRMQSSFNFVPGVMGMILMLICAMMTSIAIVREKETGSMEVLLSSPVSPFLIILAKAVPYFALSCVNLVSVFLLSVFVLGVPAGGSKASLLLVSVIFILVSLALGLFVSTITSSQVAAMLISGMALMMPVMILSGMIFPVESMPLPLQHLSRIIPARWYIAAVRKLMIKGLGLYYVMNEIAVLTVMALLFMTVSLAKFKKRLE